MNRTHLPIPLTIALLCVAIAALVLTGQESIGHTKELVIKALPPKSATSLAVTSPAFKEGADIPYEYTQYRGNRFPGLSWKKGPAGTRSYAVIAQGLSVGRAGATTAIQLTLFNVPASVTALKTGMTDPPPGAIYGPNVHGFNMPYTGPHTHTAAPSAYHFEVFALDTPLDLPPASSFEAIVAAMSGHVLASGELTGLSALDPQSNDQTLKQAPTRIETGLISGVPGRDKSILTYKGIPYAAPPVGELRFRSPQPPVPWNGTRTADHFGSVCPAAGPKDNMAEDCLFANVWTGAAYAAERRPVFVWFHGAGATGSTIDFDGEALAKKGLVVVTFNRRDGAFGGLATPELSKESGHGASGNYTLQDSLALLQWVHKNITAFGGDPARVSIVGESAGAGQVDFVTISPLAKGLFIRAVAQSHVRYSRDPELLHLPTNYTALKDAEAAGMKFQEQHGAHSIAELRAMPWDKLLGGGGFGTVLDGWVVPKGYNETFSSHSQSNVAFIAGNDRDETGAVTENSFARRRAARDPSPASGLQQTNLKVASFLAAAKRKFGAMTDEFLKFYPASNDDEAATQNNETVRDNSRISTYLWASDWKAGIGADKSVYTYFWTYRHTNSANGAYHGSEIQFVFDNLDLTGKGWTDDDRKVADMVSSYWANYVTTGNPNAPGLPLWPAFDPKSATVMELGEHFGPMPVATPERLTFWKRFFQTQPAM